MADQKQNPERDEIEETEDPQTAELVAYLDGELPEQDADRVEQLLLTNPPLRRNAETLDRTWQLLSSLEEATASGEFTQKTLASISTISQENDADRDAIRRWSLRDSLPWSGIRHGIIWCLVAFFACSAGLLLSRQARRERTDPADRELLEDLELFRQYPKLWRIPDVDFLKEVFESSKTSPVTEERP